MRQPVEQLMKAYQSHLFVAAFNVCKDADDNGKVYLTYKNLKFDITSAVNAGKTKFVFTADGKEHYVTIDDTANESIGSYSLSDCVGPNEDASDYEALN